MKKMSLQFHRWHALCFTYSQDESLIRDLFQAVSAAYSAPHRFYHNTGHIESLLLLSAQYAAQLKKRDVVEFSIYYHDIVYSPGSGSNEYLSALVAGKALRMLGVDPQSVADVQLFINATKTHELTAGAHSDLKFFVDFDLAILAAEREAYSEYCSNVRKEFGDLSDAHFAMGRTAFLENELKKPHIFNTEEFRLKEKQARENIRWEIEHLRHI